MAAKCCGQESYGENQRGRDRRGQLIDEVKRLLDNVENAESSRTAGSGARPGGVNIPGVRNMDAECLRYRKRRECSPPLITSLGSRELRPTSWYDKMRHENSSTITYVDATKTDPLDPMPPAPWELPRTPSQELRSGYLYKECECRKRNGLQVDCPRWECGGRPECQAVNPGPCCVASGTRKPYRGDRRNGGTGDSGSAASKQPNLAQEPKYSPPVSGGNGPVMVCVCAPTGLGQQNSPRVAMAAPQAQPQKQFLGIVTMAAPQVQHPPEKEFLGFVAMAPPGVNREPLGIVAMSPPNPTVGQGQCPRKNGLQPQTFQGSGAQRQSLCQGDDFVAYSQNGVKFRCCPLPA